MLERFGNRTTLLIAATVNLAIGALAFALGRNTVRQEQAASEEPFQAAAVPARLVLVAASLVGFAFLLMELVWYRMLSPILGGTTFMFGLVLAIALAGIGIGGALYSFGNRERSATATGFAITCTLEALAMNGTAGFVAAPRGEWSPQMFAMLAGGRQLRGILGGDAHPGLFLPKLAEYWRQGRFPFDRLLSFYPFAEIERAFADAHSGKAIKPVLLMEGPL
jgi:hypothetical protein